MTMTKLTKKTDLFALALVALLAGACSKDSKDSKETKETKETTKPVGEDETAAKDDTAAGAPDVDVVFERYESMRAALAGDTSEGIADDAAAIQETAAALAADAQDAARPHLESLAKAAGELAAADAGDMAALRLAFGEVSRGMVGLIEADPSLAEGRHVFECPMAEGYERWVQPTAELENPYMGQKMLACGSEVTDEM